MTEEPNKLQIEETQTLDSMLHQILNLALVTINAEAGSLMLVDNKQGILQIKARLGKPRPERKNERVYRIDEGSIASWVAKNKQFYLCEDASTDKLFTPSRGGQNIGSLLSVPIVHEGKVLAIINADSDKSNYFNHWHSQQLKQISDQVAGRIADRISILDALAEVGVELTRLPPDGRIESVLEKITGLALRALGADVITLYPYIQQTDEFPVEGKGPITAGDVNQPEHMRRKVYEGDVPWTVVKQRRSGFYADIDKADFLAHDIARPSEYRRPRFVIREGIQSAAALLLPFRAAEAKAEEVVGVMFVNYRTHHEFSIDEISAMATFADYAAATILNARHEERRRLEQNQMIYGILRNIAHRMNNLAGTGRLSAQLLAERISPNDYISHGHLHKIRRESDILFGLVKRLSFNETGELGKKTAFDITSMIERVLDEIRPEITGSIDLETELAGDLIAVESVDFQLMQVLRDIINNAIQSLEGQKNARLVVRSRYKPNINRVEVEVSDNGPGIPQHIIDNLFVMGTTTKKESLGFGLWWSRDFMQATGGDIQLRESIPNEVTTFVIEIPCQNPGFSAESSTARDLRDILIVDDKRDWREYLHEILSNHNYLIETAASYTEASHAIKTKHFKLAILDMSLIASNPSNEDGLKLLKELEEASSGTKIIIVTGHGNDQQKQRARQSSQFFAWINKAELNVVGFRELVRNALNTI